MDVILTHEQADFDAIGALLGAALLQKNARAVLPRRCNRNVRAFLNLYGPELPFWEARDLPPENIETITLVDTQSLVTLKGTTRRTRVHIVDHHQPRTDLPEGWTMSGERVGACTTLLVENLREHNGHLSMVQATLLLLGIYEDTGSLTYAGTTPRDVRAAAFLLEQGASLRIAAEYLNPPLSPDQHRVYERLLSSAEHHHIHGQHLIIASTPAPGFADEISSIAHKLRDLLELDALFLLVSTDEGVRLVARSTSDAVNVATVAAQFGGGGHERAAAALIHPPDDADPQTALDETRARLVSILPELVQPSLTVGKIMSRRPLLLAPDTSVQDAMHLMQRYGYEGYPVVKDKNVIGLLTRRAVDRALSHKLNITAASLMEAGEVTAFPEDTLDQIQHLMAETGWGQIPVIDPTTRDVIGIVTRTDLLKTLVKDQGALPGRHNLAARLDSAMPPGRLGLLRLVAEQAHEQHMPVYIVGGFVRDLLLRRPSLDFDIVVEGDAITLGKSLAKQHGGRMVSHARFGTTKWQIAEIRADLLRSLPAAPGLDANDLPDSLDLISARTEFYEYPTALPTVERSSIKLDLHRRDFTINTMAVRLDGAHYGELYDYWGGYNDLKNRLVRVLHSLSFVDDPTRLLRAVRFEQRFHFEIEARTLQLMTEAAGLVNQVSGDRLRHELNLMLAEKRPSEMLARLEALGLLQAIHPALRWNGENSVVFEDVLHKAPDSAWDLPDTLASMPVRLALGYLVWLVKLPQTELNAVCDRLHLPRPLRHALLAGSALWNDLPTLTSALPSQIVARLDAVPRPALYAIERIRPSGAARNLLRRYAFQWRHVQSITTGNDLRALGLPPTSVYRNILESLRSAWLDGQVHSAEEEKVILDRLLASLKDGESGPLEGNA